MLPEIIPWLALMARETSTNAGGFRRYIINDSIIVDDDLGGVIYGIAEENRFQIFVEKNHKCRVPITDLESVLLALLESKSNAA